MILLGATVTASLLPIGEWRQAVNLAIAGAKAAVILMIFMKLRTEGALVRFAFAISGVLLFILAAMLTADYQLRPQADGALSAAIVAPYRPAPPPQAASAN
jgi:cytochrome c oxidase subunit 4